MHEFIGSVKPEVSERKRLTGSDCMNYNESKFRGAEVNKFRTIKRGDACGN